MRDWLLMAVAAIETYRKAHVPPLAQIPITVELLALSLAPAVLMLGVANMLWPRHVRIIHFAQEAKTYLSLRRGGRYARYRALLILAEHMEVQLLRWGLLFACYGFLVLIWLSCVLALLESKLGRKLMRASPDLVVVQPATPWIVLALTTACALLFAVRGAAPKLRGPLGRLPAVVTSFVVVAGAVLEAERAVGDGTFRGPLLLLIAFAFPAVVSCNRRIHATAPRLVPPSWVRQLGTPDDPGARPTRPARPAGVGHSTPPAASVSSRSRLSIPYGEPAVPRPTRPQTTALLRPQQRSSDAAFGIGGPNETDLGWAALTPDFRPLAAGDPRRLGPYRVTARIAEGGMGTVYQATHSATGSRAAVKVPRVSATMAADELRARLVREIKVLEKVQVRGVAKLLDSGVTDNGTMWVAMDYISGPTLEQAVKKYGRIARLPYLRFFSTQLAETVGDLHASGIMHRDLKPSNVILTPSGPVVIDLGISILNDETALLTQPGTMIGTPAYMPPEVLLGKQFVPAGDVYAWGCVVAYAALGVPLFTGEQAVLPSRIIAGLWDDGVAARLQIRDRPLSDLVRAAVHTDPSSRPTNGYQLHSRCLETVSTD